MASNTEKVSIWWRHHAHYNDTLLYDVGQYYFEAYQNVCHFVFVIFKFIFCRQKFYILILVSQKLVTEGLID